VKGGLLMDVKLTKEADSLLCLLYKSYLEKRENGIPKTQAKLFGSSLEIQQSLITKMNPEDVDETCWELGRLGMLNIQKGDNIAYFNILTDQAIVYMENRFKGKVSEVLDYLGKIKAAIPFV